ncbi:MAG: AgmX/PglI C-terminal domain-containing protein [Myxococcales bacterium]|nr:AgmX/PglI C-terminal domain-containing protein [Myxococcales bacterium]
MTPETLIRRILLGALALTTITSTSCSIEGASAGGANGAFPGRYVAAGAKSIRGSLSTSVKPQASPSSPSAASPVRVHVLGEPGRKLVRRRRVELTLDRKPRGRDGVPVSLTSSDGSGLLLRRYRARAALQGPLALTELVLSFENPKARIIEGRFEITLPPGASISRFAMRIAGKWQEAEVVERQRARQVYEDFLHRRQDPALLEKKAGNRFRARVFPIPARGVKHIKVTYSQQLVGAETAYRLPLAGLPKVDNLDVEIYTARRIYTLALRDQKPAGDALVHGSARVGGLVSGKLAVVRARVRLTRRPVGIKSLLVLFDSSASRALGFARQLKSFGALVEALRKKHGGAMPLVVACYDQVVREIYRGRADGFGAAQIASMRAHGALGASDLSRALRWAKAQRDRARVLIISDGVLTAGKRSGLGKLTEALKPETQRADALVVGGIRDETALATVVRGALPADGLLIDRDQALDRVVSRLSRATASRVKVAVGGAAFTYPEHLDGVQDGDEALVYAELDSALGAREARTLQVSVGEQRSRVTLSPVESALLDRAFVRARIASLQAQIATLSAKDAATRRKLAERVVRLSTTNRVLSDYTALLVLETEYDYRRFGLDRRALSDILAVTPLGPTLTHRGLAARSRKHTTARRELAEKGGKKEEKKDIAAGSGAAPGWLKRAGSRRGRSGKMSGRYGLRGPRLSGMGVTGTGRGGGGTGEGRIGDLGSIRRGAGGGGGGNTALGTDARDALGGLVGNRVGDSHGIGGLGVGRGSGRVASRRRRDSLDALIDGALGGGRRIRARAALARPVRRGLRVARRRMARPRVVTGRATVLGSLSRSMIRRVVRRHIDEVRTCYQRAGAVADFGRLDVRFVIDGTGHVRSAVPRRIAGRGIDRVARCVSRAVGRWRFPAARGGGIVVVTYPFVFRHSGTGLAPSVLRDRPPTAPARPRLGAASGLTGKLAQVTTMLAQRKIDRALAFARRWRDEKPGDVLALVGLGDALFAKGLRQRAARAFGSIIDLFPSRADMRRFAGNRLSALADKPSLALARDTYAVAAKQRADHPNSHRLLAYAELRAGHYAKAFSVLERALQRSYPGGRFRGVRRVMRDDLGLVAAAWLRKAPREDKALRRRLAALGVGVARRPSLRFVMSWETDANDVDLHIYDRYNNKAFYSHKHLASGGELYADVTTGYGPEAFVIDGRAKAFPYTLQVNYYRRGPMGYGMGSVQVVQHDGRGKLSFREKSFVVMKDRTFVEVMTVKRKL